MVYRLTLGFSAYHPHSSLFSEDIDLLMNGLSISHGEFTHVRVGCLEKRMEYKNEEDWRKGILRIQKCVKHHSLGSMSVALTAMQISDTSYHQINPLNDLPLLFAGR